jgi:RNAse (barnase) inhibitor barstar
MNREELAQQLLSVENNGVYLLDASHRQDLMDAATQAQLHIQHVHCAAVENKESALQALARDLRFPDYFGHNYDALVECLSDLSWLPDTGIVLVLEDSNHWQHGDAESFEEVIEILQIGAEEWGETERVFQVFVVMDHDDYQAITQSEELEPIS